MLEFLVQIFRQMQNCMKIFACNLWKVASDGAYTYAQDEFAQVYLTSKKISFDIRLNGDNKQTVPNLPKGKTMKYLRQHSARGQHAGRQKPKRFTHKKLKYKHSDFPHPFTKFTAFTLSMEQICSFESFERTHSIQHFFDTNHKSCSMFVQNHI